MQPMRRAYVGLWIGVWLAAMTAHAARVERRVNPQTGLESVAVQEDGFELRLTPVTREYAEAVFAGRGLPPAVAKAVRGYCGFGMTLRNAGGEPVRVRLTDWRFVTPQGEVRRVKSKSQWVREWRGQGLAFQWLLVHEDATYQPGDWMQGFITVPLPPQARFDLHYVWTAGGRRHEGVVEGLRCAPETVADGQP